MTTTILGVKLSEKAHSRLLEYAKQIWQWNEIPEEGRRNIVQAFARKYQ